MKSSTRQLHMTLIRLLKGCLKAWERWVFEQHEVSVEDKPSTHTSPDTVEAGVSGGT